MLTVRRVMLAGAVLVVLVLAWAAYLAVTGLQAEHRLTTARGAVTQLRADLTDPDTGAQRLNADVAAVRTPAVGAAHATSGPLWAVAADIPLLGRPARAARGATDAVRDLSVQVLPPVATARGGLTSASLAATHGIRLTPLEQAAGPLTAAAKVADGVLGHVEALPRSTGIGPLDRGVGALRTQLGALTGQLDTAAEAATLAPPLLGSGGSRTYFLAFENEAESRGLGGLPGAYAIVQADHGVLRFLRFGNDGDFAGVAASPAVAAALGPDFADRYVGSDPTGLYVNSDVSPDFRDAAQIWVSMWQTRTGQRLDGAIVVDPTALSALLAVTGPATLPDGSAVTAQNVVALTEQQAYLRFSSQNPTDNAARKAFLQQVAQAAAGRVVDAGPPHAAALASVMAAQVGQRRLLLYSTDPAQEAALAALPLGGVLAPASGPGEVTGPFLMVTVTNAAGNKVDYYLHRRVSWSAAGCRDTLRTSTVTVALTNEAPPGLPVYAGGRSDSEAHDGSPIGTDRLLVTVYPTLGAGATGASVDGVPATVTSGLEGGRPAFGADIEIRPGQTRTLVVHLLEPTAARGPATVVTQPLVVPQQTSVAVPAC